MKIVKLIIISAFASAISMAVLASPSDESKPEGATAGSMPMMQGQQVNMPMMNIMHERQAMMQEHMKRMETHMSNIEELLKQLVELQKK